VPEQEPGVRALAAHRLGH